MHVIILEVISKQVKYYTTFIPMFVMFLVYTERVFSFYLPPNDISKMHSLVPATELLWTTIPRCSLHHTMEDLCRATKGITHAPTVSLATMVS